MKIAQIAPLIESVPPKLYGGTERVVSYLTDELVRQGHDVTLFASGDSRTSANLVACTDQALRLNERCTDATPHHVLQLEKVRQRAHEFDVLHFHVDYIHFPLFRNLFHKTITTLHGRQDLADLHPLYAEFRDAPLVSISNAQRRPLQDMRWVGTVYHGLPSGTCQFNAHASGDYFAFLGRISPEKRLDRAIQIARAVDLPIKVAAKIDKADEAYFHERIEPLLNDDLVEFVGEIGEEDKGEFLGNARALLFPIDWPEPFGLVMIESMSCGTPVIAWNEGSVSEIIDHGVTGYVVDNIEDAIQAATKLSELDRATVRERYERRFTAEIMARRYGALYRQLLSRNEALATALRTRVA
ncbi:MAG TPA: glycosyltransferase family 4 protein [Burkholderiales bacterium]|nr:glycosyltransferase family 4 protein [Burkholderiales bacterium]